MGDLGLLLLVGFRAGVEDDEEGEEQGDEVGVGDQPAVVVDVVGGAPRFERAMFQARFSCTTCGASVFGGGVAAALPWKPASLISIMRGFMPSTMEMTPSRAISRRR